MSEWTTTTIGEIASIFDGPHATPTKTQSGPWFLSISSLNDGRLDLQESAHLSELDFERWTRRVTPRAGDLLFSYETKLGAAALMPGDLRACLGRRMALLRVDPEKVDPRFLLYAYIGRDFQKVIKKRSVHGATVDRIPLSELPTWPIRIPELREQQAISAILGALDDKIAVNDRLAMTSRLLGSTIFAAATNMPAETGPTFGELASGGLLEFGDGYRTKKAEHSRPGLPILRVAEVLNGQIKPSSNDHVSENYRQAMGGKVSQPHDLVVTTKGTVGRAALIPEGSPQFVYSPQLCYFRVPSGSWLSAEYLFFWFRSDFFWAQACSCKSQTDMADYINLADIKSLVLQVPKEAIYRALCEELASLEKTAAQVIRESATLAELRDALLPKLMSGEIRVRDAEKIVEDVT